MNSNGAPARRGRWRWGDLVRMLLTWGSSATALGVAAALLPGLSATSLWAWAAAAVAAGVVGALLRPALIWVGAAVGWVGVLVIALIGQGVVMQAALWLVPGITVASFATSVAAAWTSALVGTLFGWLFTAGTAESMVSTLIGRKGRRPGAPPTVPDGLTGILFVQLDGVPAPTLQWALEAGLMPTVRRLVGETHLVREWTVQLPCTTPASQLGILHGTSEGVPAFRWYDRELGRVLVANRAGDARIIEERVSDGRGLLADDGASISNLFSGDADHCAMVFSRVQIGRGRFATRRALARFVVHPDGLARSIGRVAVEISRERFQSRRQVARDVRPRVERPWMFTGLRAATNGLLRDVNLAAVAAELRSGRRSVYVDFVDYDEVAHHAGPMRLEALAVLTELDEVVAMLEQIAAAAPRDYEIVLLSDHGQSLGTPFRHLYGEDAGAVCRSLMHERASWEGEAVEGLGRVAGLADEAAGTDSFTGLAAGRVARRINRRTGILDPAAAEAPDRPEHLGEPVVLGSGSLGLLYAGGPDRLDLAELGERWPELVPGLAEHPGIGLVAGLGPDGTPWGIGAEGRISLDTGEVTGVDPLASYPAHARRVLREALAGPAAPDLYLIGGYDPSTREVIAFEDLAGSHGGLGGWQDRGVLVAPRALSASIGDAPIDGAAALHHILVAMLEQLGHRTTLRGGARRQEEAG
ncbi:phage holin family protein [Nocardioides sambongensis]|uniref:phage holin family protein n=1 Tax=Nocardioides sambongensis TaxID=2589074 RepID=UPI00112702E6|nr:phage holin family protein [Nocardioides sambongensis]